MNIVLTIPDESIPAWELRLSKFNAGRPNPLTLTEFKQQEIDEETNGNVAAYEQDQMQKLIPLGQKYLAAPPEVQAVVDNELAPYAE